MAKSVADGNGLVYDIRHGRGRYSSLAGYIMDCRQVGLQVMGELETPIEHTVQLITSPQRARGDEDYLNCVRATIVVQTSEPMSRLANGKNPVGLHVS